MTGAFVLAIRRRLGFTQAELAAIIGTDRTTIAKWELRGPRRLRMRERAEEILIVVADFPADDDDARRELERHLRAKRPLRALKLILERGERPTVAVV